MIRWFVALLSLTLGMTAGNGQSEDRLGPYGDGSHRRRSDTLLPASVGVVQAVLFDPQWRQNPTQSATRGSRWGSTRSRNIVSRNGEIALLVPGTTATDVGIFSPTGTLLRRFASQLTRSTRGEWNTSGTEGRDLRPGQFASYWMSNQTVYFRSSGDFLDQRAFNAQTGAAQTLLAPSESNSHGYFGMCDGATQVVQFRTGHGAGRTVLNYNVNGSNKSLTLSNNDFNNPTPLMEPTTLFLSSPESIPTTALSGSTYLYGNGISIRRFNYAATTATYSRGWEWKLAGHAMIRNYDGMSSSRPICMDSSKIYLVTHPQLVNSTYPHFDPNQPATLRTLDRATGAQLSTVDLGLILSPWQTDDQTTYQVSLNGGRIAILSGSLAATARTKLLCVDTAGSTISWQYQYAANETALDTTWKSETTKLYSTPEEICVCWAKTNVTTRQVIITLDRFNWSTGAQTRSVHQVTTPGVDTSAYVEDFVVLNGRAYALICYRELVAGGTFTGGGQLFVVLGAP